MSNKSLNQDKSMSYARFEHYAYRNDWESLLSIFPNGFPEPFQDKNSAHGISWLCGKFAVQAEKNGDHEIMKKCLRHFITHHVKNQGYEMLGELLFCAIGWGAALSLSELLKYEQNIVDIPVGKEPYNHLIDTQRGARWNLTDQDGARIALCMSLLLDSNKFAIHSIEKMDSLFFSAIRSGLIESASLLYSKGAWRDKNILNDKKQTILEEMKRKEKKMISNDRIKKTITTLEGILLSEDCGLNGSIKAARRI